MKQTQTKKRSCLIDFLVLPKLEQTGYRIIAEPADWLAGYLAVAQSY